MRALSVRWRLTLVFASVTIITTTLLLAGIYLVVSQSQQHTDAVTSRDGTAARESVDDLLEGGPRQDEDAVEEAVEEVHDEAVDDTLANLMMWSCVGLLGMAGAAVLGGWFFAGRALRPVHTITRRARAISAASLQERIALEGPADELRELAETFDSMLERLESAFALERRLVATMSHELRTPLANQLATLDLALADPDASLEELRVAARTALEQSERANLTIDALLMLARAEAGYQVLPRQEVRFADVVARQVDAERALATGLTWRVALDPVPVAGHAELLGRLVQNLLANAVSYNLPDGYVDVRLAARDGGASLVVTNPGALIDATAARDLTLPFRRGSTDRTAKRSVGLGLSIVEAIARHHDGTVSLEPLPTGGLRVEVILQQRSA